MESKDWIGNKAATFATLAASNHSKLNRADRDYYATEPRALELLLDLEKFDKLIWECACGGGHLSEVLKERGHEVFSTDIEDRGYEGQNLTINFLESTCEWGGDIITNPPYREAQKFVEKAIELISDGSKVAMFLKLLFLESKSRKELFKKYPPKYVYVASSRLNCVRNGKFKDYESSAVAYAWFIWEKGFKGEPTIRWFN